MNKVYWVDISITAKSGKHRRKLHVAYDGKRIIKINSLTELADAEQIYIDSSAPETYDEILELLKRDIKVYLLTKPQLIKEKRIEAHLAKSDENDAKVLSMIPIELFKELAFNEIVTKRKLQPLLEQYETASKRLKVLKQWKKEGWEFEELKALEKRLARMKRQLERRILETAEAELKIYRFAETELGLRGVSLVSLLIHVDFSRGIHKIKGYVKRNRKIRDILAKYAVAIYTNAKKNGNGKYAEIVIKAKNRKEALKRLQVEILKDLRRLWRKIYQEEKLR